MHLAAPERRPIANSSLRKVARIIVGVRTRDGGCLLAVHLVEPFVVSDNHVSSRPRCGAIPRIARDMT